jgi:hypothetical protein
MAAHARDVARLAFREPGGRRAARACGCARTFGCHSCVRRAGSVPRDCGQVRGYLAARVGAQNTAGFLDGTAVVADSSTIGSSSPLEQAGPGRRRRRHRPHPPKIHGARLITEAGDRLRERGAAGLLGGRGDGRGDRHRPIAGPRAAHGKRRAADPATFQQVMRAWPPSPSRQLRTSRRRAYLSRECDAIRETCDRSNSAGHRSP